MSAVETIRNIPVIVEHRKSCQGNFEPMDLDQDYSSGFPFDNTGRRSRDPLEDIAQRHPEIAQHLQGFPRRSPRTGSEPDEDEFIRRFDRPFSSGRFDRFGFPFDRDEFEREAYPEYSGQPPQSPSHNRQQSAQQHSSSQTPQGYQQYPPQYSQQYQPQFSQQSQESQPSPQYQTQRSQSVSQGTQTEAGCQTDEPPQQQEGSGGQEQKSEGAQTRGRPIQQSNTCDLAHPQPPDEALNERGPRSMSAPPENKRFTTSVKIPMGGHHENGSQSPGGVKSQSSTGSTERVIPIHVEGRDEPVIPKHTGPTPSTHSHHQPTPERIFTDAPRSQPETIFGRRPEAFTQFVHREPRRFSNDWPHSFGGFPEEEFGFKRTESPSRHTEAKPEPHATHHQQQMQPPQRQETSSQAHASKPQPQEQKPIQPEPPKQQPQKQPQGPIEQIQAIQKDVSSLLRQVEAFNGAPRDKNYLYLDEMLTRNLLKLDNIDTQGQDAIRSARKEAIKCIERAIGVLEAKAAANVAPKEDKMEVEQTQEAEKMETEEPKAMEMSPAPTQNEGMDVTVDDNNKSAEGNTAEQQPKSAEENVDSSQEQDKKEEVKNEEQQKVEVQMQETAPSQKTETSATTKPQNEQTPKESEEVKTDVQEGEKEKKKKIKKKVNKEDKEKKQ